jgi:hypothetical protein
MVRSFVWTSDSGLGTFAPRAVWARAKGGVVGMSGMKRTLISLVLVVTLLCAVCTVRPAPVYANSSGTTIAIILGGVIGGLALIAVIVTLIVRNNPAWMPAVPSADAVLKATPWDEPAERVRFGLGCGVRDGGVPLVCW